MAYVAVIIRADGKQSERDDLTFFCIVHKNKDLAIKRAIKLAQQWSFEEEKYVVKIGQLTHKVDIKFDLVKE